MSFEDLKIFGVAEAASGDKYYYRMQGAKKGDTYELYLEASNHTDEGSYVAFVTLKEVYEYLLEDLLGSVPSNIEEALEWLQEAFDSGSVKWVIGDGGCPQLVGKHREQRQKGEVLIDIRFPPSEKPMTGGLTHDQASMVRSDIFGGLLNMHRATRRKLDECEKRNRAFTYAMHKEICKAEEGGRSAAILERIRSINGGGEEMEVPSLSPTTAAGEGSVDGKPEGAQGAGVGGARVPARGLAPGQKVVNKVPKGKKRGFGTGNCKNPTGIKQKKDNA